MTAPTVVAHATVAPGAGAPAAASPAAGEELGSVAALLMLADGRFPDGSHAHSFGMEAAANVGRVRDPSTLLAYIEARLWSTTRTDAGAAALVARGTHPTETVDHALELRMPGEVARTTSRSLGRSLLRTAERLWPGQAPRLDDGRSPLQPVAFGAVAALAGCSPSQAALCSVHASAAALSSAALRLLGLDPFAVAAVLAELRPTVGAVAASIDDIAAPDDLPVVTTPIAELDPELGRTIEPRLFGS
jgi:urease accessory protein